MGGNFSLKELFICVILMLYTECQSPTMPGTCQKVCVGGWGGVGCGGCKPILVFSFGQAEQQWQLLDIESIQLFGVLRPNPSKQLFISRETYPQVNL